MSYIDSYNHEIVGMFGDLPVYHPLEDIPGSESPDEDGEFACATSQLVIGGGDGEWPGLVVTSPVGAVAQFLVYAFEDDEELETRGWNTVVDEFLYTEKIFNFSGWGVRDHHVFYELCNSLAMAHSYKHEKEVRNFETWLACGIGESIFFSMPDLATPIMSKLSDPYKGMKHIQFNNIMAIPPNMPVYARGGNAWAMTRRNNPQAEK
jgi:hypothetical protein